MAPRTLKKEIRTNELQKNHRLSRIVKTIVQISAQSRSISSSPIDSLRRGNWVKLICGASFEDVVDVRNLSLVYTLGGVDCIDCAAEASVVNAVNEGIEAARQIAPVRRPWVMVSVNDDEDLHFRKADKRDSSFALCFDAMLRYFSDLYPHTEFDPLDCPPDCSRPCERVCPAEAIPPARLIMDEESPRKSGVITERCYGYGRCLHSCPYDKISAITYVRDAASTLQLLRRDDVDDIEIHTNARQTDSFKELWNSLAASVSHVKLVAASLPDVGDSTLSCMKSLYSIMKPNLTCHNLWQLDGRPMSGDIGRGTTRETIAFAVRLAATSRMNKFLSYAISHQLFKKLVCLLLPLHMRIENYSGEACSPKDVSNSEAVIGGVAYGGYARKIVGRVLHELQNKHGVTGVENHPLYLESLREAMALVGFYKRLRPFLI
ncbi:hypothetical protein H6P81_019420 [Aristolochia fimbriata]|uniref:4Fe-4S ferredoxin-type domain-containing protein n=1 Tax=Aristolochia fimbriata TaxID=158543 RepID=A0AAV7DT69_ARIFI|nr:hypothetical protein H6P81_019420 [Aristolochia fimbriata]